MTIQETFNLAEQALERVIDQIKDDQWELIVPEGFARKRESLRTIVNYHAYDDAWVPDVLSGKTIDEVGSIYDGDLLGSDPKANYHAITEKAQAAVSALTDLDKTVHLSYGDFSAGDYLLHTLSFRFFRAYDIAVFIGVDPDLSDDLVAAVWEHLGPHMDDFRKMGVFNEAIAVPDGADQLTKLIAFSGRTPA
jgi:uncharacterized protein (TIGR03086 family)